MPVEPVAPRPAATVLLLRDRPDPPPGRAPLQVFLQRRVAGMAFAGGMTVFPGGGVDPADSAALPWAGPGHAWWGERLGCPPERAGALVVAAVRETFEECGVLLADHVSDAASGSLAPHRAELVARRVTLAEVPADALDGWRHGELELMAPTFRTLEEIAEHADTAAVLTAAQHRTVRPVAPRVRREGGRIVLVLPGEPGFEVAAGHLRPADLR